MNRLELFTNKIVIITGAASGIGKAIANELLDQNAIVYMIDVNEEALMQIAGSNAIPVVCDVTDHVKVKSSIESIHKENGKIDFLFTVAGIGYAGEMSGYTVDAWNRIMEVNLLGVINCVQTIYPIMKDQQFGRIVNVASVAGLVPSGLLVPYATTKHAVVGLSKSLRLEAELNNVKVHLVFPGGIDTNMLDQSYPADMPEASRIDARRYLGKITGKPRAAESLAKYILKKLTKNKMDIYYPAKVKEIWWLYRHTPKLLNKLALKSVKEELKLHQ